MEQQHSEQLHRHVAFLDRHCVLQWPNTRAETIDGPFGQEAEQVDVLVALEESIDDDRVLWARRWRGEVHDQIVGAALYCILGAWAEHSFVRTDQVQDSTTLPVAVEGLHQLKEQCLFMIDEFLGMGRPGKH